MKKTLKLLSLDDLRTKGINFHRAHLHRLIKAKKFPRPVKVGENKNAWVETEIDSYIADKIATRDAEAA